MKRVDKTIIRPIRCKDKNTLPVKGKELIDDLYCSVFLSGKTGSGKSTVLAHLLKPNILLDKRTTVIIWASTVDIDPVYVTICNRLRKKDIPLITYTEVIDDQGVNTLKTHLDLILDEIKADNGCKDEEEEELLADVPTQQGACRFPVIEKPKEEKVKPVKKKIYKDQVPRFVLVFDDLDIKTLRSDYVCNLVKKSRHFQAKVFISGQMVGQLTANAFNQLHYLYMWGGFSLQNIKTVYERLKTHLSFDEFYQLYREITDAKYGFMNIKLRTGQIKSKFDKKYIV